jgi:predicted CoA-binding protein
MASVVEQVLEQRPQTSLKRHNFYSDGTLRDILGSVRAIALVGASTQWRRPSFYAMKYLQKKGYRVIPVNPARAGIEILGELVYERIAEIPVNVDMVDVFRTSEEAYEITKDVIAAKEDKGIRVLWMQLGVRDDAAAELAEAAGLTVIMDRCPKIEFARLSGELSWSGINSGIISAKTLKRPNA